MGSNALAEIRQPERSLEQVVSMYIRRMTLVWLDVDDPLGPSSFRGYLERNAIALLSNYGAGKNAG